jgi:hypothetical protein
MTKRDNMAILPGVDFLSSQPGSALLRAAKAERRVQRQRLPLPFNSIVNLAKICAFSEAFRLCAPPRRSGSGHHTKS